MITRDFLMKIHTPKFIFNTAVDFFNLGTERCERIFTGDYSNDTGLYLRVPAPATVLAFAMELMLKSILLYRNGDYPKIHRLLDLYNQLSQIDKSEIEEHYSKLFVDPRRFPTFRYAVESKQDNVKDTPKHSSTRQEILHELKIHDVSFVKWRYVFSFPEKEDEEELQYNFAFIVRLFEASFNYSENFHKT